jgi:hypothetical protein
MQSVPLVGQGRYDSPLAVTQQACLQGVEASNDGRKTERMNARIRAFLFILAA